MESAVKMPIDLQIYRTDSDAPAWSECERHVFGLFGRDDWLRLLSAAGFERVTVRPLASLTVVASGLPQPAGLPSWRPVRLTAETPG